MADGLHNHSAAQRNNNEYLCNVTSQFRFHLNGRFSRKKKP